MVKRYLTASFRKGAATLVSLALAALLMAPCVALGDLLQVITAYYDDRGSVVGIGQNNCDGSSSFYGIYTNNMVAIDRSRCDNPTYLIAPTSDYLISHSTNGWCNITNYSDGSVGVDCYWY